jgi:APA family basic amino acid/polyamine antiporter
MVGWALVLEFAVAASAVSVGWSNYFVGLMERSFGIDLPEAFTKGIYAGGFINLPAAAIALLVTSLLVIGTRESATVNSVLVAIKVVALTVFVFLAIPVINGANFEPFAPNGFLDTTGLGVGVAGAAASIFFAYVGFDAVATAAEETKDPQRNIPIGLIGSLAICTVFYLLVAPARSARWAPSRSATPPACRCRRAARPSTPPVRSRPTATCWPAATSRSRMCST